MDVTSRPDLPAIRAALARIAPYIVRTPVLTSAVLDEMLGTHVWFKCENLQAIGAFKARGATNAVLSMAPGDAARGVVTHSSGNHGAALAFAARLRGIPCWVVMPENAPASKQANVRRQGGNIRLCAPNLAAREAACAEVQRETGAVLVHPFDDDRIIAGQGTAVLELLEVQPKLDAVVVPCGGGGLLSGTAIAATGMNASVKVYGAEPRGADDAHRSLAAGHLIPQDHPQTIADGLRTSLSERTFGVIRSRVEAIATASEASIVRAMRLVWELLHVVTEPSSAVPLACMLEGALDLRGRNVGIILTGGNVDLDRLPWQAASA